MTATPVDRRGLEAAVQLFVTAFVVDDKRAQMRKRLLLGERRGETLVALPRWLGGRTAPLEGVDRSPDGLRKRFGELVGVHIDATTAARTTIVDALARGRSKPTVFIADSGNVALVTLDDGSAILCSRF